MKFEKKIDWLKQKRYFDIGYGWSSYLKVIVAVVGIGGISVGMSKTIIAAILLGYGIFCYIFGWAYVKYDWYKAEIEVTNRFNLFVKEMRKKIK